MESALVFIFCRWVIGLTFAYSAVGKASALASFRSSITELGILPQKLAGPAALGSIVAEGSVVVLAAAGGVVADGGFSLAAALLAVFSPVLVIALSKKADVSCSCFGSREQRISWYDPARNAVLGLCCAAGLWTWAAPAGARLPAGLILAFGLMAGCFVVIVVNLEDVIELLRRPYLVG